MTTLTETEDLSARIAMIEFALEVTMANWLAKGTVESSNAFKKNFRSSMGPPFVPTTNDQDIAQQIGRLNERCTQLAAFFVNRVARHETSIRGARRTGSHTKQ